MTLRAADLGLISDRVDGEARLRGRRSQSAGASFERDLDLVHEQYALDGLARIERLPVPTQPLPEKFLTLAGRQRYRGRARVLASRQTHDYSGRFIHPRWRGLSIAMEAKASAERKPSMPILGDRSHGAGGGIVAHQLEALATAAREGATAALVWRAGDPWQTSCFRGVLLGPALIAAWERYAATVKAERESREAERGAKSIPAGAFTPYTTHTPRRLEHWLGPVMANIAAILIDGA